MHLFNSLATWDCSHHKVPKAKSAADVNRLAIGVEGGFDPENAYDIVKSHSLVVFPDKSIVPLSCAELPAQSYHFVILVAPGLF